MPTRDHPPVGAPCWADLWTSDVAAARRFYSELLGWEAQEPSPEFGGYFMFTRHGVPVAGGMGDMPDLPAQNIWTVYLATDDIAKTVATAEAEGARVANQPMPVADLGIQVVLDDATGAHLGAWQPGTFPGFTVLGEPGTPSWFELATRDYDRAVGFYRSVFRWDTSTADTDEFRYTTLRDPSSSGELAGILDAAAFLPAEDPGHWTVYWQVEDVDAAVEKATALGGSVLMAAQSTPYGRIAAVTDPAGAALSLRTPPA